MIHRIIERGLNMYSNLYKEMKKKNISEEDIAKVLDIKKDIVILKLKNKDDLLVEEAKKIKFNFFPDLTMEYLFESNDDK